MAFWYVLINIFELALQSDHHLWLLCASANDNRCWTEAIETSNLYFVFKIVQYSIIPWSMMHYGIKRQCIIWPSLWFHRKAVCTLPMTRAKKNLICTWFRYITETSDRLPGYPSLISQRTCLGIYLCPLDVTDNLYILVLYKPTDVLGYTSDFRDITLLNSQRILVFHDYLSLVL